MGDDRAPPPHRRYSNIIPQHHHPQYHHLRHQPNRMSESSFFFSEQRLSQLFNVDTWPEEVDNEGNHPAFVEDDIGRDPPPEPAPRASYCPPSPEQVSPSSQRRSQGPDAFADHHRDSSIYSTLESGCHIDPRFSADVSMDMARLSTLSAASGRFSSSLDNNTGNLTPMGVTPPGSGKGGLHISDRYSNLSTISGSVMSRPRSSLPSVLSELAGDVQSEMDLFTDDSEDLLPRPMVWASDEVINWQERCLELELSLQRFRDQAGKIRELLREKLSELEQRVVEAEARAQAAEDKVCVMEQRAQWNSFSGETLEDTEKLNRFNDDTDDKEVVISNLASQVEEQRALRLQDARKVEAKAAKIKDWVTNKLKELEEQNTHLREQNAKCNVQLELLRGRLHHLSSLHTDQRDRETEDSSRGSYEGSHPDSDESLADRLHNQNYLPSRPATLGREQRSKSRSPGRLRRASLSDSDSNYAGLIHNTRSPSTEKRSNRDSRVDSGSVDMETPQSLSPKSPLEAMLKSLTQSTSNLTGMSNRIEDPCDSPRKPVPQPRTKHLKKGNNLSGYTSKSADSLDLVLDGLNNTDGSKSSHKSHSRDSCLSDDGHRSRAQDEGHDYSEIYTPSKEQTKWLESEGKGEKPPTPPLHRFPSWESRIYQVAQEGLSGVDAKSTSSRESRSQSSGLGSYPEIHVPVYAAVKGRASQIRSVPFTGDSSDSSDGEEPCEGSDSRGLSSHTPSSSAESSSSSPSKSKTSSISPAKFSGSSPSKSVRRDMSFESGTSDDYAVPPDARSEIRVDAAGSLDPSTHLNTGGNVSVMSARTSCVDTTTNTLTSTSLNVLSPRRENSLEKSGYLTKLGGKLKTWKKRYFILKDGTLTYWKSQGDIHRKPAGQITLTDTCRVTRSEGAHTFEVNTGKKTYYLTADNTALVEDWVKVLQNVLRRLATRLLLNSEDSKPTLQGWLTKVKHGHPRRCWCMLIGKMFIYFKNPSDQIPIGQINMRDAQVEEVEKVSDSEGEECGEDEIPKEELTIGIFPSHQGPTYLIMPNKQEKDAWLYHLTIVSGGGPNAGTQYEQLVQKLMELEADPNCVLWRHPMLLYSKEAITSPLSSLPSTQLQVEAIKLFKSCQLFTSVLIDSSGIDYHVVLCQNALQQCLTYPELQSELFSGLIKQTSKHIQAKPGVQVTKTINKIKHSRNLLFSATQSLFLCDSSGAQKASPTLGQPLAVDPKLNPPSFTFIQGWQFLALSVSLFIPKNNKLLWYLKLHLQRNADTKTEAGKYAAYCQRALERSHEIGGREAKPSRMEVLSILLKNPYHHSLPHAIPVHFINGTYQVIGFDGSTTIDEFLESLNHEIVCRDVHQSGFALFSDDPIEKELEHCLNHNAKLCDVISKWETALREKGSGKFENTKVIRLLFKSRLYCRAASKHETDKEKLFLCYQTNQQIQLGKFPITRELALELATLMSQIDMGEVNSEKSRSSGSSGPSTAHVLQAFNKFYPPRYKDNLSEDEKKSLLENLQEKWVGLRGRSQNDCVRIYLTCTRKWPYFGATLFPAKTTIAETEATPVWVAVSEDAITLLDNTSMQPITRYAYNSVVTFGGCQEDFMLVVHSVEEDSSGHQMGTQKLLLCMNKPKILELTLLIADYMNALGRPVPGTPLTGTLTRHGSRRSGHSHMTPLPPGQPDIIKMASEVEAKVDEITSGIHSDSSIV